MPITNSDYKEYVRGNITRTQYPHPAESSRRLIGAGVGSVGSVGTHVALGALQRW